MKRVEPTSSNESGSIQNLVSYSFIGVVFLVVLFVIVSNVIDKERGIEVLRPDVGCGEGSENVVVISINEIGDFLVDGKTVEDVEIVTLINLTLEKLDRNDILSVLVKPNDKSQMEDFAKIYDLLNGVDDSRMVVNFK